MQMAGVRYDEYPPIAHLVRPFLEGFAGDGAYTADDLEEMILDRRMQCWVGGEGTIRVVCLTEVVTDRLKTLHVSYCGGAGFRDWVGLMDDLATCAKAMGCGRIRATCRPGYEKFLTQQSFTKTHIVMDRDLRDAEHGR